MSAECSQCGADLTYPEGTWPVGECEPCYLRADRDAALKRAESYRSKLGEVMGLLAKAADTEADLVVCRDRVAELEHEVERVRAMKGRS
jgi:hypothetical protein